MKYTLYVDAKNGNDENSGKQSSPFASAARAFDEARAILSKKPVDLTLQFKKGSYAAASPLALDGKDFPAGYSLTLKGEKGAAIRGTYDIPARLFKKVEGKEYYSYALPKELFLDGKPPKSKAVYFNGDTRDRAASEYTVTDYNETLFVDENGEEYYSVFVKEDLLSDLLGAPRPEDGKPSLLCDPKMELSIVLSWYFSIVRIEGIDYAHSFGSEAEGCHPGYVALRLANPDGPHFNGNPRYVGRIGDGKHRPFLLYGNLAFLHKAGQYYYDETAGIVYYYPKDTDDMEGGVIGLGICEKLLSFTNMENVTVEGLRLGGTTSDVTGGGGLMTGQAGVIRYREPRWCNDAAIYASNIKNITVRGCTISDTYYDGVALDGSMDGVSITGCDFKNIGASSIAVLAPSTECPARNLVIENNYSVNSGYVFNNCCGFFITHVANLKLCHNSIIDSSYSGISVGFTWCFMKDSIDGPDANVKNAEVAYNYIENPMIRCYDGGAIYINGGTVDIKKYKTYYNSMHHNFAYCGTPKKGNPKCMETSTSLYHDNGASHWHTHDNVVWADEETLTIWSYISLQGGLDNGCARVLCEDNYILNIKEDHLTCGKGRVDARRYIREKHSVMLYKGNCPQGFQTIEGTDHAARVNGIVLGAGAVGRKNAKPLNLTGYQYKVVGEANPFKLTGYADEMHDSIFQQFDYLERWFKFSYSEVRRLGAKRPEDYSDYESQMFREGFENKAKIVFSSIDTTVGLSEFGLYSDSGKLERAIRFAQGTGCQSIRIYGGLVPEGDDPEVYYGMAVKTIRAHVAAAEEKGIDLWLTMKRGTVADTAERCRRIVEEIGSESLRIAFSPAEASRAGLDVMAEFEIVRPYLACLEITDLDEKGMSVPVGGGVLPYEALLRELVAMKYDGFLCLEPYFGRLGGRKSYPANGKNLLLDGPNSYRNNAAYLALKDVTEKIGCPIA